MPAESTPVFPKLLDEVQLAKTNMPQFIETPSPDNIGLNGKVNKYITFQEIATLVGQFFTSKHLKIINFNLKSISSEKLGFLGLHELLTIEACEEDADPETCKKILTFFVKTILPSRNSFDELVFKEECKFYQEAVPQLMEGFKFEPWAAKCYLAKENFLILEDLKSKGFEVSSGPLNINQLKAALTCVARFHASSIMLKERLRKPLREVFGDFFKQKSFLIDDEFSKKWILTGIEVVEAIAEKISLDPKCVSVAYELAMKELQPAEEAKNVLCHADLWSNNMMLKQEHGHISCRLVDFQMSFYTSYAVDLAHLIYFNTTKATRLTYENECVELYHSVLKKTLRSHGFEDSRVFTRSELLRDLEQKRICGLVTAVQFFPVALLNKNLSKKFSRDAKQLESYMYASRKDFILAAMELDAEYRGRNEEAVSELIEYAQKLLGSDGSPAYL